MSASQQGPDLELKNVCFRVEHAKHVVNHSSLSSCLGTHGSFLSLSLFWVFDASWAGEQDGTWGGGKGFSHSADVKCKVGLTFSMQTILQVQPWGLVEETVVKALTEQGIVHRFADEEWQSGSSGKGFWAFEGNFRLFAHNSLKANGELRHK